MNMKVENEMALPITKSVTVMLLEPYAGKLARTVLRGESSRKGADLLDMSPLQQDCIVYVSYSQFSGEKSIKACRISSRTLRKGLRYLMEKVNKMSANTLFLTKCHSNLCPKLSDIE